MTCVSVPRFAAFRRPRRSYALVVIATEAYDVLAATDQRLTW